MMTADDSTSSLSILPNAKKIVLCLEDAKCLEQGTLLEELADHRLETEIYIHMEHIPAESKNSQQQPSLLPFSMVDAASILTQQLIGTHLFISGKWPFVQAIKEQACSAGFSEDEITTLGIGPKEEKVFCVKCYSYNRKVHEKEISCEHCHTHLQVSNHYSRRHQAYLGNIRISKLNY